jgi:hypothetical protein
MIATWLLVFAFAGNLALVVLDNVWWDTVRHISTPYWLQWADTAFALLDSAVVGGAISVWQGTPAGPGLAIPGCLGCMLYGIVPLVTGDTAVGIAALALNAVPLAPLCHSDTARWCQ